MHMLFYVCVEIDFMEGRKELGLCVCVCECACACVHVCVCIVRVMIFGFDCHYDFCV